MRGRQDPCCHGQRERQAREPPRHTHCRCRFGEICASRRATDRSRYSWDWTYSSMLAASIIAESSSDRACFATLSKDTLINDT